VAYIRDARPTDAERLAEIHVFSWKAAYRGVLSDAFLEGLAATTRLDWWESRLARVPPRWAILVAEETGRVSGFVTTGHCDDADRRQPGAGELQAMYVDPGRWGHGLGRDLLLAAEERFRVDAYHDASLWVLRDNVRARRFYERGGWSVDGADRRMIIGSEAVGAVRYLRVLNGLP
jgi:ribosomal protein S18 acetylase RimI-like enzyme